MKVITDEELIKMNNLLNQHLIIQAKKILNNLEDLKESNNENNKGTI